MSPDICQRLAREISSLPQKVSIHWHAGEPLAVGCSHFRSLLEPFADLFIEGRVSFVLQTNATLITDDWCDLFKEFDFNVGVSLDGDGQMNHLRKNWGGDSSFDLALRGMEHLRRAKIPFTAIAVASGSGIEQPERIYEFFAELGCEMLGINMVETLSAESTSGVMPSTASEVSAFWQRLFMKWAKDKRLKIREFEHMFSWLAAIYAGHEDGMAHKRIDMFPCVSWNGDVNFLSPEFIDKVAETNGRFVVGNILQASLGDLLRRAVDADYVLDFAAGRRQCAQECEHFSACGGGTAANKFFETGSANATETQFCRNMVKLMVDGVLDCAIPGGGHE